MLLVAGELYLHSKIVFGANKLLTMVDGYAFLERQSRDACNEAGALKDHIESCLDRYDYYPQSVHVDKMYRNRENQHDWKDGGITL